MATATETVQERSRHVTLRAPVGLENIRPVDLVVCSACNVVVSLHAVTTTEQRPFTADELGVDSLDELKGLASVKILPAGGILGLGSRTAEVEGVFCPQCGQLMFDRETWTDHVADRKIFDRENGAPKAPQPVKSEKPAKGAKSAKPTEPEQEEE